MITSFFFFFFFFFFLMLLGSSNTAFGAAPAHHGGVGCETTFQDLVPANDLAAFAVHGIFPSAGWNIALERVFIFETMCVHTVLAFGAFLPANLRAFVPTDVNVFTGEQRYHLHPVHPAKTRTRYHCPHNIHHPAHPTWCPLHMARRYSLNTDKQRAQPMHAPAVRSPGMTVTWRAFAYCTTSFICSCV